MPGPRNTVRREASAALALTAGRGLDEPPRLVDAALIMKKAFGIRLRPRRRASERRIAGRRASRQQGAFTPEWTKRRSLQTVRLRNLLTRRFPLCFVSLACLSLAACGVERSEQTPAAATLETSAAAASGPTPVLFVHGWAGSAALWSATLERAPRGYAYRALDLPGFGSGASLDRPYSYDSLLEFVIDAMDDSPAPVVLVGHSLGAMLAQDAALLRTKRIAALVLANSQPRFEAVALPAASFRRVSGIVDESSQAAALAAMLPRYFLDPQAAAAELALLREAGGQARPRALRESFLSLADTPPLPPTDYGALHFPVLVVGSEADLIPPAATRRLAAAFPDACLVVLPDAGHMAFLENARAWNAHLTGFLRAVAESRSASAYCEELAESDSISPSASSPKNRAKAGA